MNQDVELHIEGALNQIRALFVKAATRIEDLKVGEKIPATTLADVLAKELGMTGPQIYPTLKILFTQYPGVVILRGAHGGILRMPPVSVDVAVDATEPVASE